MTPTTPAVRSTGTERFSSRHIGPRDSDTQAMLDLLGYESLDALIDAVVPKRIRVKNPLALPAGRTEFDALRALRQSASRNELYRSYIGMGYSGTITPPVVLRNVLENPAWYTAYTPYQAEIAQGRLEALLNFQTLVTDLTSRKADTTAPLIHPLVERWSPRAYDPTAEVSTDVLRTILEAARWAPSANNTQPWRFIVARRGSDAFTTVSDELP